MDKNKFVLSLLMAVLGILMLIGPQMFIALAVILLGLASVVDGAFIMVATRNLILDPDYRLMMTIRGVLSIVVGAVAVLLPLAIAAVAWTVMAYVLGGYLIVSAGLEIYGIMKLHRNGIMIKQSVIETAVSLVLAMTLFIIPAERAGSILVRICGVVLLAAGCLSAFLQWHNRPIVVVPDSVVTSAEDEQSEEE